VTRAVLALLAIGASLVQVGAVPVLFLNSAAAPLLPVALLAAWGTMRHADEVWPALLLAPIPLGVASEERLGWFLLALLPTAALLLHRSPPESLQKLGYAPLAAALGALGYLVLLWVAAGEVGALPDAAGLIFGSAIMTAALAALLAVLLWPVRARRTPGLFR
jgi:hypothetical protein